jgi:hypothetical protein
MPILPARVPSGRGGFHQIEVPQQGQKLKVNGSVASPVSRVYSVVLPVMLTELASNQAAT